MYNIAAALGVLFGLLYVSGHHEIGAIGDDVCRYGGTLCDNPHYVLSAAILAAVWGKLVSIR
jgi:hypothetical protein